MNHASTLESSKHKRAHGGEGPESEELDSTNTSGQSASDDESKLSLTKGKSNTREKGKRQKVAATAATVDADVGAGAGAGAGVEIQEPTVPSMKNKRVPLTKKVISPEKPSPPAAGTKKGAIAFMTRKEAEIVFDMAIESANWGLIMEKLNSSKSGSSVSSSGNLKRHVLTVLKKQALSGYH